jgi:hypothetical protein
MSKRYLPLPKGSERPNKVKVPQLSAVLMSMSPIAVWLENILLVTKIYNSYN